MNLEGDLMILSDVEYEKLNAHVISKLEEMIERLKSDKWKMCDVDCRKEIVESHDFDSQDVAYTCYHVSITLKDKG